MTVAVEIRRGSARFLERAPGRATHHSLSFGPRLDPERVRFGPMVCHDDHWLADGAGFEAHRHSGLEIVTWVVTGALRHTGPTGEVVVPAGHVAVLSTGDGVEHAEVAAAPRTRFVQVWLTSDRAGEPSYEVREPDLSGGALVPVAEPLPGAHFSVARLPIGASVELPAAPRLHAFLASGALTRFSLAEPLSAGDAFEAVDHPGGGTITAAVPSELLLWTFDA